MQKNYIILAHKNPKQLKRLVERLKDDESFFYIHIDKFVNIELFSKELHSKSVKFIENRVKATWGDIGAVIATINSLKAIRNDSRDGYCILLSGQDYPIKGNLKINSFLNENSGSNFIDLAPVQQLWPSEELDTRLHQYKFNLTHNKGDYILIPSLLSIDFFKFRNIKKLIRLFLVTRDLRFMHVLKRRKLSNFILPYGGSQWWALTTDLVYKILEFIDSNGNFLNYHRFTLLSDEIFFHSIVNYLAVKNNKIKIKRSLTYVNWSRKNVVLPVTFTNADIFELINQPDSILFARKFDTEVDENVLNQLDNSGKDS